MKKLLFLLVALSSVVLADGPLFRHKDTFAQQEFDNVYQDIRSRTLQLKILQVLTSALSSDASTTSGSFTDTGLSASITPSSTASKVLIFASGSGNSGASNTVRFTISRGATNLGGSLGFQGIQSAGATTMRLPFSMVYLDSPLTASATTYHVQFLSGDGATTVEILGNMRPCQIVVCEVNGL